MYTPLNPANDRALRAFADNLRKLARQGHDQPVDPVVALAAAGLTVRR